jgi:proteic killer suppression protein
MIVSFSDKKTENLFKNRTKPKGLPENIIQRALEKLIILNATNNINDFIVIPGNNYEKLKGERRNESSIRINDQWRIVFEWKDGNSYNVKIEDYH